MYPDYLLLQLLCFLKRYLNHHTNISLIYVTYVIRCCCWSGPASRLGPRSAAAGPTGYGEVQTFTNLHRFDLSPHVAHPVTRQPISSYLCPFEKVKSQCDSLSLSLSLSLSRTFSDDTDSVPPWEIVGCSASQPSFHEWRFLPAPPRRCRVPLRTFSIEVMSSSDDLLRLPSWSPQVHLISSHHKRLGSSVKNIKRILWV